MVAQQPVSGAPSSPRGGGGGATAAQQQQQRPASPSLQSEQVARPPLASTGRSFATTAGLPAPAAAAAALAAAGVHPVMARETQQAWAAYKATPGLGAEAVAAIAALRAQVRMLLWVCVHALTCAESVL
jgi:hypothetical protein